MDLAKFAKFPAQCVLLVIAVSFAAANDAGAQNTSSTTELEEPFRSSTQPFEFRSLNPDWPIVEADDTNKLSVRVRSLTELADRDVVLVYELIRVDDGVQVGREQTDVHLDNSGNSELISIAAHAPSEPGVYEIRCRLIEKSDRIWSRFTRAAETLASVQTPWMIYGQGNAEVQMTQPALQTPDTLTTTNWNEIGSVAWIDPRVWQAPAWMPGGATRLVPNVRRVGESLNFKSWRGDSKESAQTLKEGESLVGLLSGLSPHQAYRCSVAAFGDSSDKNPIQLRVEFASSPAFETITRSYQCGGGRTRDVSKADEQTTDIFDLLHFASDQDEFIRVTNVSPGSDVVLGSVAVFEPSKGTSNDVALGAANKEASVTEYPRERSAELRVDSSEWMDQLTTDYGSLAKRGGYAETTVEYFRLWKAMTRLTTHAEWIGYNEIALGFDVIETGESKSEVELRREQAERLVAFDKWARNPASLSILPQATGPTTASSKTPAETIRLDQVTRIDQVEDSAAHGILENLIQRNATTLQLRSTEFPLVVSRSTSESIAEFQLTPRRAVGVPSASRESIGFVHVLVPAVSLPAANDTGLSDTVEDSSDSMQATVVNAAPWSVRVDLRFSDSGSSECNVVRSQTSPVALGEHPEGAAESLIVPPLTIVNLHVKSTSQSNTVPSWNASIVGGRQAMESLKEQVSGVVGRLGTLTTPEDYREIRNGGFEVPGQVGIVGWMHTQFPSTAVMLDANEAIEGTHSIRMTTEPKSAGRTWLVSEPISAPTSGRLAVSLAARANAKSQEKSADVATAGSQIDRPQSSENTDRTHRVRVSLEGNRMGKPVRFATEFDVPCDGQWQPRRIVLESDDVNFNAGDSLRLTIDSLSVGRLWIDDIHLHDQFPMQSERSALQGNAFLAIQGLQRGNLDSAAQLLNNHWSQYLLAHQTDGDSNYDSTGNLSANPGVKGLSGEFSPENPHSVTTDQSGQPSPRIAVRPGSTGKSAASEVQKASPPSADSTGGDADKKQSVTERFRDWLPRPIRF